MASEDIAPKLIAGVRKEFQRNCLKDVEMRKLSEKVGNGEATYEDAYKYAESIGTARANAFKSVISSDVLPDGKMYYNIAERLMTDSLTTDHNMVADFSEMVQQAINDYRIGIDMKAQRADLDEDRIDGFVQRLASEDNYDDVAWITQEPVKTHARSVVDDTIKKNAEFQHKAGIKVAVKRDAASDCCKWCDGLVGDYTYPGVPRDVFARHDNCRCTLDYNGRRLTAYESKSGKSNTFRDQGEQEKIEARISYSEKSAQDYRPVVKNESNKTSVITGGETIKATALEDSRNKIYLSDSASIKPKELDRIEKQLDFAKKAAGISKDNGLKAIVVSDSELYKDTGGRFDAASNTIFIKPMLDKEKQQFMIVHEMFHAKDYQEFIRTGGVYESQELFIDKISEKAKKKLDKLGINPYNVGEISNYAAKGYRKGRFDETYTEYRAFRAMRGKK